MKLPDGHGKLQFLLDSTHGVVRLNEGVVDSDNVNVIVLNAITEPSANSSGSMLADHVLTRYGRQYVRCDRSR